MSQSLGTGYCRPLIVLFVVLFISTASAMTPPQNLRANQEGTMLTISWDQVVGAGGYKLGVGVQSGQFTIADLKNVTSLGPFDVGLIPEGTYYLAVRAYGATEESNYSSELAVTITHPFPSPQNLRFSLSGRALTINWDAVEGAAGYKLMLKIDDGEYTGPYDMGTITQIGPFDTRPLPAGKYYLMVKAYDATRESGSSEEILVKLGGVIHTGTKADLKTETISHTLDSVIRVDKPGDAIHGLQIKAPAGAYTESKTFNIASSSVTAHTFNRHFKPISPLISIDNGKVFADKPLTVKIPVNIPPGEFAMAFYYDDETGNLEGIPLISQDSTSLTILTSHFSNIIVSSIDESLLMNTPVIATEFKPGIDDWQFTNQGSYISPGGHCAGQDISAMWYYAEKRRKGAPALNGLYDNTAENQDVIQFWTPGLWADDTLGYKFASTVQEDIDWGNASKHAIWDPAHQDITWKAFAFSMLLTGEPQYISVRTSDDLYGHALIAYKISLADGTLFIADPNYPGNTTRKIEFANGNFLPYNSGATAADIQAGRGISYDRIRYIGISAMVPMEKVRQRWQEFQAGTIGNDRFPQCVVEAVDESSRKKIVTGFKTDKDKVTLRVSCADAAGKTSDYSTFVFKYSPDNEDLSAMGVDAIEQTVALEVGDNIIGLVIHSAGEWIDFKWVKVRSLPERKVPISYHSKFYLENYGDCWDGACDGCLNLVAMPGFVHCYVGDCHQTYVLTCTERAKNVSQKQTNYPDDPRQVVDLEGVVTIPGLVDAEVEVDGRYNLEPHIKVHVRDASSREILINGTASMTSPTTTNIPSEITGNVWCHDGRTIGPRHGSTHTPFVFWVDIDGTSLSFPWGDGATCFSVRTFLTDHTYIMQSLSNPQDQMSSNQEPLGFSLSFVPDRDFGTASSVSYRIQDRYSFYDMYSNGPKPSISYPGHTLSVHSGTIIIDFIKEY